MYEKRNTVVKGEIGEVVVKGSVVMTCYFSVSKATVGGLEDSGLITGDMGQENAKIEKIVRHSRFRYST